MLERTLDYTPRFDPRSRAFGVAGMVSDAPRVPVWWAPGPVLNQGAEGACVGHGWTNDATAAPTRIDFTTRPLPEAFPPDPQRFAFSLYEWCRRNDEYPDT